MLFRSQVKMFAATFSSLLRGRVFSLLRSKKSLSQNIDNLLQKISLVLKEFRVIVEKINQSTLKEKNKSSVLYADEHVSNVIELQLMELYNHLQKIDASSPSSATIVELINSEQKYKKQKVYDSPKDKNSNPEELLYKRNQLKKYVESVFFLNQDIRKDGAVFEQSMLALAAGLAMVFSTGIAFYYQMMYGNFTMPFFIDRRSVV